MSHICNPMAGSLFLVQLKQEPERYTTVCGGYTIATGKDQSDEVGKIQNQGFGRG